MLESIYIDNFRSIKDTTLNLQRVNLFIGPNNSGKSNFLKAIEFFARSAEGVVQNDELLANFFKKQGYAEERISDKSQPIKLALKDSFRETDDIEYCAINYFGIDKQTQNQLVNFLLGKADVVARTHRPIIPLAGLAQDLQFLRKDNLREGFDTVGISDNAHYYLLFKQFFRDGTLIPATVLNFWWSAFVGSETAEMSFSPFKHKVINTVWEKYKSIRIYKPDPLKMIAAFRMGDIQNETVLSSDISNIIPFLETMRNKFQSVYKQIETDLEKFSPEFKSIAFETIRISNESYRKLGLNTGGDNNYWAEDLSEGVLYFLGLLCIIHQPQPPAILLLEEPEKGIHPRRIQEVMRLIFELAYEKDIQVIITTHSTIVVDQFEDIPESVFVFEMHDEATSVKNLKTDIIEPSNKKLKAKGFEPIIYTNGLGEHWSMGFLGGVPA